MIVFLIFNFVVLLSQNRFMSLILIILKQRRIIKSKYDNEDGFFLKNEWYIAV